MPMHMPQLNESMHARRLLFWLTQTFISTTCPPRSWTILRVAVQVLAGTPDPEVQLAAFPAVVLPAPAWATCLRYHPAGCFNSIC